MAKHSDLFNGHFLSVTQNKTDFLQCRPSYERSQRHIRVCTYSEPVILHFIIYKRAPLQQNPHAM